MFKNLKLRTQLYFGFAAMILLLMTVAGISYWGLIGALDGFTEYRRLARANNRVADFQDQMLSLRLAVKNFVINHSDKAVQDYREDFSRMMALVKELKENVKDPERAKPVALIDEQAAKYDATFTQVTALAKQRQATIERMNEIGVALRQTATKLIDTAAQNKNLEEAV
ncbi:MAG: hypothetical protein JNK95_14985, partial [Candidatus Competibacter sp.]|nr:hypothetical protein [Candidatus Competibacter sp.]